jgi:hypothetical protein
MVEIYNDKVIDLFKTEKTAKPIDIKEDESGRIYLTNSLKIKVENIENMEELYLEGLKNRKNRSTEKND